MTGEQFEAMPGDNELLDGEIIEIPGRSARHSYIIGLLTFYLNVFLLQDRRAAAVPGTEFAIGENRLRPDIAVLSKTKFERLGEGRSPVRELPEIAVEIASPSESASAMERKVAAYLEAGVSEVWVIYPRTQHLFVHTNSGARLIDHNGLLTTAWLPGWSLVVGEIFRD